MSDKEEHKTVLSAGIGLVLGVLIGSFTLTNFRPSWVNSSLPHVGEKVTLISIESFRKR